MDDRPWETETYPWKGHALRHLRLVLELDPGHDRIESTMPVLPDLLDPTGALRLGAVAMLVDFTAGSLSIRSIQPDWTVTFDLELHLTGTVGTGTAVATSKVVRAGRNNVITEQDVRGDDGEPIAHGMVTFTRLRRRDDNPRAIPDWTHIALADEDEAPRRPIDDFLGFVADARAGTITFEHDRVVANSIGAIQGGVLAHSFDAAGATVGARELDRPARTTDLHLYYLALGQVGPFQVRTRILRATAADVVVRCVLVDTGADDRELAVGTVTAQPC